MSGKTIPIADQIAEAERAFNGVDQTDQYEERTGRIDRGQLELRRARRASALATLRFVEKHADRLRAIR